MSAFRKSVGDGNTLKGTRISVLNGSVLTSTGIASLDELFGGGLPISRVLLLKCDRESGYHNLLLKYFLAEGIEQEHEVCLISLDADRTMSDIMAVVTGKVETAVEKMNINQKDNPKSNLRPNVGVDKMSIAWRYQNTEQISSELGSGNVKVVNGNVC